MASFLDTLSSAFTGQAGVDAAARARDQLINVFGLELEHNRNMAIQSLGDLYNAREAGLDIGETFYPRAQQDVLGNSLLGIQVLRDEAGRPLWASTQQMMDALGQAGPAGVQRAQQQFQTGPGYQFALGQGLESIAQQANAAGMLASGNMLRESQQFGQGLANQEWNNYLRNVMGQQQLYAPLATRESEYWRDLGNNLGTLNTQQANYFSNLYNQGAQNLANVRGQQTGQEAQLAGIFGPGMAQTELSAGAAVGQAGANSVNLLSDIFGGNRLR